MVLELPHSNCTTTMFASWSFGSRPAFALACNHHASKGEVLERGCEEWCFGLGPIGLGLLASIATVWQNRSHSNHLPVLGLEGLWLKS